MTNTLDISNNKMTDVFPSSKLLQCVRNNLLHMNSWSRLQIYNEPDKQTQVDSSQNSRDNSFCSPFLTGIPPHSLHPQRAIPNKKSFITNNVDITKTDNGTYDDNTQNNIEFVFPIYIDSRKLTMSQINSVFESISHTRMKTHEYDIDDVVGTDSTSSTSELQMPLFGRPARVILAVVNCDGTIVYYFVHDGLVKPKKN